MFVVAGATGRTGSVVLEALLSGGHEVRAVVRDASVAHERARGVRARGAEIAVASLDDAAGLSRALRGAEGAYLLVPPDPRSADPLARGEKLVSAMRDAVVESGIPRVVFLSSIGAHLERGTGLIQTLHRAEETMRRVPGLHCTFLRAAFFMENVLDDLDLMKARGILPVFGRVFGGDEDRPFPMVATRDVGRTAAQLLVDPLQGASVIELAGPVDVSYADVARTFSRALGRTIVPAPMPLETLVPVRMQRGASLAVSQLVREMTASTLEGRLTWQGTGARSGRGKVTLDELARAAIAARRSS